MPKTKVSLDVTNLDNFIFDMSRCIKCKGCNWVDHTYMPGVNFSTRCPSATRYLFDSYGAYGKMRIGLGIAENRLGLLKRGHKVLGYEGNMGDEREFDMAATKTRFDIFLESLGLTKPKEERGD